MYTLKVLVDKNLYLNDRQRLYVSHHLSLMKYLCDLTNADTIKTFANSHKATKAMTNLLHKGTI